jgi:hypothetical protein
MPSLLHVTYFPNVAHMAVMLQADGYIFEAQDTYLKQTYRNRTCIYAANGKLQLNIPVIHSQNNRQLYKDVMIKSEEKWQINHLKSLESAYRKSPFFEYYIDDISVLFEKEVNNLFIFNLKCLEVIFECLQLPFIPKFTETFIHHPNNQTDFRSLVYCKKEVVQHFEPYTQVFDDKHGFIGNLSILDLLFNEGPNTVNYLKSLQVKL